MKSCSLIGRSICASSSTGFIISFLIGHRHCLFCWWPVIWQFWRVKLPFQASNIWSRWERHFWETVITLDLHLHCTRMRLMSPGTCRCWAIYNVLVQCVYPVGHVSCCATLADWATDINVPVQLVYGHPNTYPSGGYVSWIVSDTIRFPM